MARPGGAWYRPTMKTACFAFAAAVASMLGTGAARAAGNDELVEKVIKIFERIADEADANKPDCDKIGAALAKHLAEDVAVLKQSKEADAKKTAKQRDEERDAAKAKYGARMQVAMAKAAPLKACKTNDKVKAYAEQVMR
jgi:hypothetical protein